MEQSYYNVTTNIICNGKGVNKQAKGTGHIDQKQTHTFMEMDDRSSSADQQEMKRLFIQ